MRPRPLLIAVIVGGAPLLAGAQPRARAATPTPPQAATGGRLPRLVPAAPRTHGDGAWGRVSGTWPARPAPVARPGYGVGRVRPLLIVVAPNGSTDTRADVVEAPRATPRTKVIAVSPAPAPNESASPVAVEWLRDGMLRLRLTAADAEAREVTLVVADGAREVLAAQRVKGPPYTAVFDLRPGLAFVGATVVRADGSSTLTLTPLGAPPTSVR